MRFSGHETFQLRYAWLPKAYGLLSPEGAASALSHDEVAMVELGVGKNMVRAIRFWVQATGVSGSDYTPSAFGDALLARQGLDPFLEDVRTLWLIHWRLCQNVEDPLFAWDYLMNRWHLSEISPSKVLPEMIREAELTSGRSLSPVTLGQHLNVFLHTYVPTRSSKGSVQEDSLDSPLVELELLRQAGERPSDETGRREPVYVFRRDRKPEISPGLFAYCLHDYWRLRHRGEGTLSFRQIATGHGSPGQVFKLPEEDLRERLDTIERDSGGRFVFRESAATPHVTRAAAEDDPTWDEHSILRDIYAVPLTAVMVHV